MCNVSKGRVTQWITAGLIDDAAIVGEDRSAAIDVDVARAELKERRAVNESCGLNGLSTKLDGPAPSTRDFSETVAARAARDPAFKAALLAEEAAAAQPPPANSSVGIAKPVENSCTPSRDGEDPATVLKAEKLKQNEILTRKQEMEELTRHGKWMVAADVTGEMNRLSSEMIRIFEGCFPDVASAVAAKFQISQREVLHLLRSEFRQAREQLVATRKAAAAKSE
jgi:hypothetical protein